jgi:predicted DNA-binding WGR domain protein
VDQDFSPVQHTIVLRRDADARTAHFYVLTLERDLFGTSLSPARGEGGNGRAADHRAVPTEEAALEAVTALAAAKRRRGYIDL